MRNRGSCGAIVILVLASAVVAQQTKPPATGAQKPTVPSAGMPMETPSFAAAPERLQQLLEAQVKAEWEAVKKRDKNSFSKLLADDFVQVEADGDGARNRYKAANELAESFLTDYHLQLFKTYALAPNITYVRYENTMEFPARSALRYKRMWISELWIKQGPDWKLWRYQETPVR